MFQVQQEIWGFRLVSLAPAFDSSIPIWHRALTAIQRAWEGDGRNHLLPFCCPRVQCMSSLANLPMEMESQIF